MEPYRREEWRRWREVGAAVEGWGDRRALTRPKGCGDAGGEEWEEDREEDGAGQSSESRRRSQRSD